MAFNNLSKYGVDSSDMQLWATANSADAFVAEVREHQRLAFTKLMKNGAKGHDEHAGIYNAFDKVLKLLESAKHLK